MPSHWDLPLAKDPVAQGLIAQSCEQGGMGSSEIARFMNISESRVRRIVNAAVAKLRHHAERLGMEARLEVESDPCLAWFIRDEIFDQLDHDS